MANKILSVFVDESGTFSNCESHDDKYVVGLVFHDQDVDISSNIRGFKDHLKTLGKENHFVHTAPLIRREAPYENDLIVYDPVDENLYVLDGYNYDYLIDTVEKDRIVIVEEGPNGYGDPVTKTYGTVKLENGKPVFIPDAEEP